ncbi:probable inactive ribonuclease-like protein 12 [Antechinus flavipes]|uniref:probable inactive ribonuclease-like protein 12 n=1 Tax=Antechinus flavipes TaxID=38775 RepID=UPI0022364086|nr:probable inactive ribonuclease-like protein 12 [Antechinus flavipes]
MDLASARTTANKIGEKAKRVNGIFPLLLLLVLAFLLMLGLSRDLNDDNWSIEKTFEEEHIDYPKSQHLFRYCNAMILSRKIRNPKNTCKQKHTFIHEKIESLVNICKNFTTLTTCKYPSRMDCHLSQVKFQLTHCKLIEGTKFPGCKYNSQTKFKSILFNCDELGPVYLHAIIEDF